MSTTATAVGMSRDRFRFFERLRVRWAEIDAQQIVFNGHYLTYFDTAVGGYWRALALPYAPTMQALGAISSSASRRSNTSARPITTSCSTSACAPIVSARAR